MSKYDYIELQHKSVPDSDGFMTDYTLYLYQPDNGPETYFCMFGDRDIYDPDIDYADFESENYDEAVEWFENYRGFEDDDDSFYASTKLSTRKSKITADTHDDNTNAILNVLAKHGYDTSNIRVKNYASSAAELIDNADDPSTYTAEDWYQDTIENYPEDLAALNYDLDTELREKVRDEVSNKLTDIFENALDSLAYDIESKVKGYNSDWCDDVITRSDEQKMQNALDDYADVVVDILFNNKY